MLFHTKLITRINAVQRDKKQLTVYPESTQYLNLAIFGFPNRDIFEEGLGEIYISYCNVMACNKRYKIWEIGL